jgi:LmbE family N-acetylglucosaminyl deacetylase
LSRTGISFRARFTIEPRRAAILTAALSATVAILSPHFDDAVLSCWSLLESAASVLVVNVFAGAPRPGAPAGWWDALSGRDDPGRAVRARSAEDRAALALVGRKALNLGFLDLQYRTEALALGPIFKAVRHVLPTNALVLGPAGLTSRDLDPALPNPHPDHLAVRDTVLALRNHGFEVGLYADLPHANAGGWPEYIAPNGRDANVARRWRAAFASAGLAREQLAPDVRRLEPDVLGRKLGAVRLYASQLETLELLYGRGIEDPDLLGYEVIWRLEARPRGARRRPLG